MTSSASTVGPKGQVVIPKEVRDELGIHPGDRMRFWIEDGHVAAQRATAAPDSRPSPLRGRFKNHNLVADLQSDREADQTRETAS